MDLQKVLKFVQVLTGVSVVILGIYTFITVDLTNFQAVVLNAYLVFFGLLLALSGTLGASATPILKYFAFFSFLSFCFSLVSWRASAPSNSLWKGGRNRGVRGGGSGQ